MSKEKFFKEAAKITDTFLGFEDHGFFTAIIHVDYGHVMQGIGLRVLGYEGDYQEPMRATKAGCDYIMHTLKACGVKTWEQLKGCRIQVLFPDEFRLNMQPIGIEGFEFDGGSRFLFSDFEKRAKYEHDVETQLIEGSWASGQMLSTKLWVPGWRPKDK